jgi:co-chaperonin GroES (HSP10)
MPFMTMQHETDPAEAIRTEMGDISSVEVFNNQVLVAVYIRPQKTKSGIILTNQTTDEDRYQSKVGLVVKMGSQAFKDNSGQWFSGLKIKEGDWIVFRPSDGWSITVHGVLCRTLSDMQVKKRVQDPDEVW